MNKIYTKGGDKGYTTLYGGTKIRKSDPRVAAYGAVDEANAAIGAAAADSKHEVISELLRMCQRKLFLVGSELASDERGRRMLKERITMQDAALLEEAIDIFSQTLTENTQFIVPGLTPPSARLHVARTAVRRAERGIVGVKTSSAVSADIIVYMNRLSDLLFVMSRVVDEVDAFKVKEGD